MEKSETNTFHSSELVIELNHLGSQEYAKVSYPLKYGIFSRLETKAFIFEFNLNHEIRHAKSKTTAWLHPSEWLKRTQGNDWVYYSSGGYAGVLEAIGEYYLPNLTYPTNSLLGGKPFLETEIKTLVSDWHKMVSQISGNGMPTIFSDWLARVKAVTPAHLTKKAIELFDISGSRVSVMPPDARHVDYNIIPLTLADGCLYKCQFCRIKNKKPFTVRSETDISLQIDRLKRFYGRDILNCNSLFLGEHDALNSPPGKILGAIEQAYMAFEFKKSYMADAFLFFFGSADSLLNADMDFFKRLDETPFLSFINIGLESYDDQTLDRLGKPLTRAKVKAAFQKIQEINRRTSRVEITCNFVMDEALPESHFTALMELIRESTDRTRPKGTVYLSPLSFGRPSRQVLYDFYRLKSQSRFPTFLYIIQRL